MKYLRTFRSAFGMFLLGATLCLQGAGAVAAPASGTLASVLESGKLRVAVALYPPWAMKDDKSEKGVRGFEVDVAEQIAKDLGVKPEFKVVVWDSLLETLLNDEADIIISGWSITTERALKVNFSNPYASSGIGIATNLERTSDFGSLSDLNDPEVSIAVVTGTVSERLARRTFERAKFVPFPTNEDASKAVVEGKTHAFVVANPVPRFIELRNPDKVDVPLEEPLIETREAFAVRKGDPDFVAYLNAWINAREADTWIAGHHDYWFKSLRWRNRPTE